MQTVKLDDGLYRTDADNGVTVVSEQVSGVRSVTTGIWVKTASAHEVRPKMGVSHLLEHMVFKGTERRSARDIALELEVRGGSLDAFTARDHTSYQARVLDEDLPRALDVLVEGLVEEPEIGRIYEGPVKSTTAFGAFIEIMPGTDGLCHISELDHKRVEKTEDVLKKGDIVKVKLLSIDERGRMRLSRKAVLEPED